MPATAAHGKRADARRNIEAILDAGLACLAEDPDASIGHIAKRAGVGRMTLYGHFATRAELIDAVFTRALADADKALNAVDLSGDPRRALTALVEGTWQIVNQSRALLETAQRTLSPQRLLAAHAGPMHRVHGLIERGVTDGSFRSDLPVSWLVTVFQSVVHGAAEEINAGRLAEADAARFITETLLAAYAPPPGQGKSAGRDH